MSAPSLRIPIRADVTQFQRDMERTGSLVGTATKAITKNVIEMNTGLLATQGAAGSAALAFGKVLGVLTPLSFAITGIVAGFKFMGYATDLAKTQIEKFYDMTQKANASGFSTEYFQRISKAAEGGVVQIDDLTAALKRFNDASTDKLGGSDLAQRLTRSREAGNFSGNAGVPALAAANTSEERLRAVTLLINQALEKGERLAALDIAGTAFGPKVQAALRANSGYLDEMVQRADAVRAKDLISAEDLGRALAVKLQLEDAQKILENKWKPIQDDIAKLGMNYHQSMVDITVTMATAVGHATELYKALRNVPDWFAKYVGGTAAPSESIWTKLTNMTTSPESRKASEASLGITSDPVEMAQLEANRKLAAAMQNRTNITRGMQEATDVYTKVLGDNSKALNDNNQAQAVQENAYTRAQNAIEKHVARLNADREAIGLGAGALEEYRARAQLVTAAQQAGIPITSKLTAEIQKQALEARAAGDALAKMRVNDQIKFDRQTAFLSQEDLQIAQQLRTIYGTDVPAALGSSEAAAMRFNNQLKSINDIARQAAGQFANDLVSGLRNGEKAMDAIGHAAQNLSGMLTNSAITELLKGNLPGAALSGFGAIIAGDIGAAQRKRSASNDNDKEQSDDSDHRRAAAAT